MELYGSTTPFTTDKEILKALNQNKSNFQAKKMVITLLE